jgi:hypothetical protein
MIWKSETSIHEKVLLKFQVLWDMTPWRLVSTVVMDQREDGGRCLLRNISSCQSTLRCVRKYRHGNLKCHRWVVVLTKSELQYLPSLKATLVICRMDCFVLFYPVVLKSVQGQLTLVLMAKLCLRKMTLLKDKAFCTHTEVRRCTSDRIFFFCLRH